MRLRYAGQGRKGGDPWTERILGRWRGAKWGAFHVLAPPKGGGTTNRPRCDAQQQAACGRSHFLRDGHGNKGLTEVIEPRASPTNAPISASQRRHLPVPATAGVRTKCLDGSRLDTARNGRRDGSLRTACRDMQILSRDQWRVGRQVRPLHIRVRGIAEARLSFPMGTGRTHYCPLSQNCAQFAWRIIRGKRHLTGSNHAASS